MSLATHTDTTIATAPVVEGYRRGTPAYTRITLSLFAAGLAAFVSMYSAQALLPSLASGFAVGPAAAALTVSVTTGVLALVIIPVSALSERYGRTRVMVVSALASAAIGLLLPLSPSLDVLIVGRALQGATLAGVPAVAMAYLAEEVHGGDLGAAMGRYVAGTTIGGLTGRLVPTTVLGFASWRWAMLAATIVALAAALVMARIMPDSRRFRPQQVSVRVVAANVAGHLADSRLRMLFALGFILMGGFVAAYNFLGFRLEKDPFDLPASVVGLVFLIYLSGTVTSSVAGRLSDRYGRRWVLLASISCSALGLVCTLVDALPFVLVGMVLFTAGFFASHSVASGWVGVIATRHRAEASALYLCAYYMGSALAGAGAGIAFGVGGWPGAVACIGGLLAIGAVLAVRLAITGRTNAGSRPFAME